MRSVAAVIFDIGGVDIGRNLKAARAPGMATIRVEEPAQALRELSALLGFDC